MEDYFEIFTRIVQRLFREFPENRLGDPELSGNRYRLESEIRHGIVVSNLAFAVAKELDLPHAVCYDIALAGFMHDIGKLRLQGYINGQEEDQLVVEELKYVRMHSTLGYETLKEEGFSEFVLKAVLHHHENYDGTGYPDNLSGKAIPLGARVIRVCDVYSALRSDRPYRRAFDVDTAMEMMVEEVKNFDMEVFLAFLRVMHKEPLQVNLATSAFDRFVNNYKLSIKGGINGTEEKTSYRDEGYPSGRDGDPELRDEHGEGDIRNVRLYLDRDPVCGAHRESVQQAGRGEREADLQDPEKRGEAEA